MPEIVAKSGIARTSLYWHLPPRLAEQLTVAPFIEDRATASVTSSSTPTPS